MNSLNRNLKYYRSQHKTLGCKITHMVGIPAIVVGLLLALSDRRREGTTLLGLGVILQLTGHFVFEHNRPVLMTKRRHPLSLVSALVFVGQSYARLFKGEPLVSIESNGRHERAACRN